MAAFHCGDLIPCEYCESTDRAQCELPSKSSPLSCSWFRVINSHINEIHGSRADKLPIYRMAIVYYYWVNSHILPPNCRKLTIEHVLWMRADSRLSSTEFKSAMHRLTKGDVKGIPKMESMFMSPSIVIGELCTFMNSNLNWPYDPIVKVPNLCNHVYSALIQGRREFVQVPVIELSIAIVFYVILFEVIRDAVATPGTGMSFEALDQYGNVMRVQLGVRRKMSRGCFNLISLDNSFETLNQIHAIYPLFNDTTAKRIRFFISNLLEIKD